MATVRTLDGAIDIERRSIPLRGFFAGVATYWNAIREGAAAADEYNKMVRNGTPHEEAVTHVFREHFARR